MAPRSSLQYSDQSEYGVTLLELLFTTAITSAAMAMAFAGYSTLFTMVGNNRQVTSVQIDQLDVFSAVESDVRNAGADPLSARPYSDLEPAVAIVDEGEALAGGLRIRMDITGVDGVPDGDFDDADEMVVYHVDTDTGTLTRWAATGDGGMVAMPLLTGVSRLDLALLDQDGIPLEAGSEDQTAMVAFDIESYVYTNYSLVSGDPARRVKVLRISTPNLHCGGSSLVEEDDLDDSDEDGIGGFAPRLDGRLGPDDDEDDGDDDDDGEEGSGHCDGMGGGRRS